MGNNNSHQNYQENSKVKRFLFKHERQKLSNLLRNKGPQECVICTTSNLSQCGYNKECGYLWLCNNFYCGFSICTEHFRVQRCHKCEIPMCSQCGHTCPRMTEDGFLIL